MDRIRRGMRAYIGGILKYLAACALFVVLAILLDTPENIVFMIMALVVAVLAMGVAVYLFWKYLGLREMGRKLTETQPKT
ncbi:MAG: hypothetical protein ABR879_03070 [Methanomassiliicoccales archaeon]